MAIETPTLAPEAMTIALTAAAIAGEISGTAYMGAPTVLVAEPGAGAILRQALDIALQANDNQLAAYGITNLPTRITVEARSDIHGIHIDPAQPAIAQLIAAHTAHQGIEVVFETLVNVAQYTGAEAPVPFMRDQLDSQLGINLAAVITQITLDADIAAGRYDSEGLDIRFNHVTLLYQD